MAVKRRMKAAAQELDKPLESQEHYSWSAGWRHKHNSEYRRPWDRAEERDDKHMASDASTMPPRAVLPTPSFLHAIVVRLKCQKVYCTALQAWDQAQQLNQQLMSPIFPMYSCLCERSNYR